MDFDNDIFLELRTATPIVLKLFKKQFKEDEELEPISTKEEEKRERERERERKRERKRKRHDGDQANLNLSVKYPSVLNYIEEINILA